VLSLETKRARGRARQGERGRNRGEGETLQPQGERGREIPSSRNHIKNSTLSAGVSAAYGADSEALQVAVHDDCGLPTDWLDAKIK
jgi:hypothetical protein